LLSLFLHENFYFALPQSFVSGVLCIVHDQLAS